MTIVYHFIDRFTDSQAAAGGGADGEEDDMPTGPLVQPSWSTIKSMIASVDLAPVLAELTPEVSARMFIGYAPLRRLNAVATSYERHRRAVVHMRAAPPNPPNPPNSPPPTDCRHRSRRQPDLATVCARA